MSDLDSCLNNLQTVSSQRSNSEISVSSSLPGGGINNSVRGGSNHERGNSKTKNMLKLEKKI